MSVHARNIWWTGNPGDVEEPWFRDFVAPGLSTTPRLIWWLEPDMLDSADLLLTAEQSDADPIRVRPGEWVHEFGGIYGCGQMGVDGVVAETLSRTTWRAS